MFHGHRLVALVGVTLVVVVGSQLVSVSGHQEGAAAGPAGLADHHLRSGPVSVAAIGEKASLHAANATDKSLQLTLRIIDQAGKVVRSRTVEVAPGRTATLSFDPSTSVRLRGELVLRADASILCNGVVPVSFEVLQSVGGVMRTKVVLDPIWHHDEPVA